MQDRAFFNCLTILLSLNIGVLVETAFSKAPNNLVIRLTMKQSFIAYFTLQAIASAFPEYWVQSFFDGGYNDKTMHICLFVTLVVAIRNVETAIQSRIGCTSNTIKWADFQSKVIEHFRLTHFITFHHVNKCSLSPKPIFSRSAYTQTVFLPITETRLQQNIISYKFQRFGAFVQPEDKTEGEIFIQKVIIATRSDICYRLCPENKRKHFLLSDFKIEQCDA